MDPAPDLSLPQLAQFIRQHTHDLCNELNGLDLEATLLADFVPSGEAAESVTRIHGQIRRLAAELRGLSAKFIEAKPTRALYAARELFLIWQDQPAAFDQNRCQESAQAFDDTGRHAIVHGWARSSLSTTSSRCASSWESACAAPATR